ncbi:MAG: DEAD/DEAH box helicase [Candidatus Bathyarchaeia archaeon]
MSTPGMNHQNSFELLCRPVRTLIDERGFDKPTAPQQRIIPHILEGRNALLISATATGKTEAAMLPVMDRFLMSGRGKPGISILYITPLRALNRDIMDRMTYWCNRLDIKLGVRHGDTSDRERDNQRRSPPDMLITTPETLQAVLLGRVLRRYLQSVRWVIVDEIHELADNKRGSQLSLALERLRELTEVEPQMIGLSATIGSPERVANFLVGENRPVEIMEVSSLREHQFEIIYPQTVAEDYQLAGDLYTHPEVAARLRVMRDLIEEHESTLLFTNTRSTSEVLTSRFNLWDMGLSLSIHHGSLAKTSRIAAEEGLKTGGLKTVVCTSSLELGIDIGSIDLVIQYNSPRQVTRLLQRVGRSGHRIDRASKGVIISLNSNDALESMVICRRALGEKLEAIKIPQKPLDVLVNQLVAEMMYRGRIYYLKAKNLFSGAYPYRNLTEQDIKEVAHYMHNRFPRLAWVSDEDEVLIKPRGSRNTIYRYFYSNLSMIPDEKDYLVIDVDEESPVGILQEAFVAEYAKPGVKFTLRGRPWKILNVHNDKIHVRAEDDPTGAIPSWVGEQIPVPLEVALEVGEIKSGVEEGLREGRSTEEIAEELSQIYPAGVDTIKRSISEVIEHYKDGHPIPTDRRVVVEDWEDQVIIHAHFGSLPNRTISRIIGHIISEETGYPVGVKQESYIIVTQTVGGMDADYISNLLRELADRDLEGVIEGAVKKTGLFKRRLINVARKAGALSKYANFSNITLGRLMKSFEGTPIFKEALKDTYRQDLDIEASIDILERISSGEIEVVKIDESPDLSSLGRIGVDSLSLKSDIVPPEKLNRIILESAKIRLLNETRTVTCLGKKYWVEREKIKNLPDDISCPRCGSTEIGLFDRDVPDVAKWQSLERQRSKREPPRWWSRGVDASKLISMYGRRAAIIAAAKNVDFEEAWDILAETEGESEEFYKRVIEAEREALKRRFI